jgi:4-hydroxy-4-methyl-2-oxoglutarate aldolase
MAITAETLRKLAQFDTPTISNVIELFEVRPHDQGYMDGRIRCRFPELPPMVGFALTTSFRGGGAPSISQPYRGLADQVRQYETLLGPAVMVFQDLDDPSVAATFGEMMCRTYHTFGSVGLITSGAGRDLAQVHSLRYPVFTSSAICSHGYGRLLNIGLPVDVGGLHISQGDLLHGDLNGVTTIPVEIASEVADVAGELIEAERIIIDYSARRAVKDIEGLMEANREFARAIEKPRARVSQRPSVTISLPSAIVKAPSC